MIWGYHYFWKHPYTVAILVYQNVVRPDEFHRRFETALHVFSVRAFCVCWYNAWREKLEPPEIWHRYPKQPFERRYIFQTTIFVIYVEFSREAWKPFASKAKQAETWSDTRWQRKLMWPNNPTFESCKTVSTKSSMNTIECQELEPADLWQIILRIPIILVFV